MLPARSHTENRCRFDIPTAHSVMALLRNPTYSGAYVFGRTRNVKRTDPTLPGFQSQRLPEEQWRVVIKDHFAGYIDWDTFQLIQSILAKNYAHHRRRESPGVARDTFLDRLVAVKFLTTGETRTSA